MRIKKYITYTAIFITQTLFCTSGAFGAGEEQCLIEHGPSPELNQYLNELSKVLSNFNSELSSIPPSGGIKNAADNIRRDVQRGFNKIISWDGYYSYADYYMLYGTSSYYSPEVRRDYEILEQRHTQIENILKNMIKRGYENKHLNIQNICSGVKNCHLKDPGSYDILTDILKNHEHVMNFFRLSILGKTNLFSDTILFVENDFEQQFRISYNELTTHNCAMLEGNIGDRVKKEILSISQWQTAGRDGIKEWQDAISLLNGAMELKDIQARERQLLQQELSKQGMSFHASEQILNNLDRYNQGKFSENNNFITNSFDYARNSIKSQLDGFRDSILENFSDDKTTPVSSQYLTSIASNIETVASIETSIAGLYQSSLPYTQIQDDNVTNLEMRMMDLHVELLQAINALNEVIPLARKICNDQGRGIGICE